MRLEIEPTGGPGTRGGCDRTWSKRSRIGIEGEVEKERETKEDGRYVIFYTFDEDEDAEPSEERGTG